MIQVAVCLVSDLPVDVIVTCGFTLCVIQVTEHGVDVMVMCGFTLCVIQVAGEHRYHPECFQCQKCRSYIGDGDTYALVERSKLFW